METIHGQDLKELLVELYKYYFSICEKSDRETEDFKKTYEIGLFDGCIDAVSIIYLALYGMEETLNLWHSVGAFGGLKDDKTTGG